MLEEQLSFLLKPDEGMLLAENFRVAMGIQNYPNIEQFVHEIKAKKNSVPPKKPAPRVNPADFVVNRTYAARTRSTIRQAWIAASPLT